MARNIQRDELAAQLRKDEILRAGFRLFSTQGIEPVSIQSVADEANVGVATVYKYYGNKPNLVANVSAYVWREFIRECEQEVSIQQRQQMNAYQLISYYADMMIHLYTFRPDILRFSSSFKTYINREGVPQQIVGVHLNPLAVLREQFHVLFEEARHNGCIRTDVPEDTLYTTCCITMLSMAERYAVGIVWADNPHRNHEMELRLLKQMLLNWLSPKEACV